MDADLSITAETIGPAGRRCSTALLVTTSLRCRDVRLCFLVVVLRTTKHFGLPSGQPPFLNKGIVG